MSNEENEHHNPEARPGRSEPKIRYVPIDIRAVENDDDEIDLVDIFKTFWDGRKTLYKTVAVFIILGLFVALVSVKEYTSEVKVMPETQEGMSLGALGGLAQQFGFSGPIQQTAEGISANLYPSIIQSNVFLQELMAYEVPFSDASQQISLKEYMSEHQNRSPVMFIIRLPFTLKNWIMSGFRNEPDSFDRAVAESRELSRLVRMNSEDWEVLRNVRDRITAELDNEIGVVSVSVKMQDPFVAAAVADYVVQKLSDFIVEKRTEKTRENVEFIEERFEESKLRFEEAQKELAAFHDANRGQLTAMARTEEQLLQSRYDLNFNLYNSLAERLEEARIKLQEDIPVINIIEPAAVPDKRSEPNRTLILIVFTFLGGIIGIGLVFGSEIWDKLKEK